MIIAGLEACQYFAVNPVLVCMVVPGVVAKGLQEWYERAKGGVRSAVIYICINDLALAIEVLLVKTAGFGVFDTNR